MLTLRGFRDLYLLIFLHVETRRVFIAPATFHPNKPSAKELAAAFPQHARETRLGTALVMHDRDTKFTQSFDDVLKSGGVRVQKAAPRSPNTNAYVERFVQTLQQECLDYFIVFGKKHMNHLVSETVGHYHEERPHQGKDNEVLSRGSNRQTKKSVSRPCGEIQCRQRLGGLLKHYNQATLWAGWMNMFRVDGWTLMDFSILSAREIEVGPPATKSAITPVPKH